MATDKTPSSKHGRLHEEEAARDKSVTFGTPDPAKAEQERQKNLVMRNAMDRVVAQKPVERNVVDPETKTSFGDREAQAAANQITRENMDRAKSEAEAKARADRVATKRAEFKPAAKPDISARMDALRSALSDKYPHNDVQVIPEGLKVAVPTGHITIESEKVAACADNAAIRAYIDALPIS